MKLYSLKQSKVFHHLKTPEELRSSTVNSEYKAQTVLLAQKLIRIIISEGKCFLMVTQPDRVRSSRVILEQTPLEELYLFQKYVIIVGENGYIGWTEFQQIQKRFRHYQVSKLIFSTQHFHEISHNNRGHMKFTPKSMRIVTKGDKVFFISYFKNHIQIFQFNNLMELAWKTSFQINLGQQLQEIQSLVVDNDYQDHEDEHLCFIVTILVQKTKIKVLLCEVMNENKLTVNHILDYRVEQQQKCVKLCRMKSDFVVISCNSLINLIEKDGDQKWNLLSQLVPIEEIISMFQYENRLVTYQKCQNSYNLFIYNIELVISFKRLTPYLLNSSLDYAPISVVKSKEKSKIFIIGEEIFLLYRSIYRITSIINDCQVGKEQNEEDYDIIGNNKVCHIRRTKAFSKFKIDKQSMKELECLNNISPSIKHIHSILLKFGIEENWIVIFQLISQFLSAFIYLTHYGNAVKSNIFSKESPYFSRELTHILQEADELCRKTLYQYASIKAELPVNLFSKLHQMSKSVPNMITLASYILSNQYHLLLLSELKLPELLFALFDQIYLVEYLLFKIKQSHLQNNKVNYNHFQALLISIVKYFHDFPPLVYLIANKPYEFMQNSFHRQKIHEIISNQLEQNDDRINFLKDEFVKPEEYKRYNGLFRLKAFSLPSEQAHLYEQKNIYIKTNFEVQLQGFQGYQLQLNAAEKQERWKISSNTKPLMYGGQVYVEISEDQTFNMVFQMQQKVHFELSGCKHDDFLNFCFNLKTLNARTVKLILLQHEQSQLRSSYNKQIKFNCQYIHPQKYSIQDRDKIHHQIIRIEQENLIDTLLQNYLLQVGEICNTFNLSFTGKHLEKKKEMQFSNFLKEERLDLSEIQLDEDTFYSKQFHIQSKQVEQPYVEEVKKNLWQMYLSLLKIQELHFQVYEHIRQESFINELLETSKSSFPLCTSLIQSNRDNFKKHQESLLSNTTKKLNKSDKDLILKLHHQRKSYKIALNTTISQQKQRQLWLQMIEHCLKHHQRWLGDPFDLLEQLLQISYYISQSESCKSVLNTIFSLFKIEFR